MKKEKKQIEISQTIKDTDEVKLLSEINKQENGEIFDKSKGKKKRKLFGTPKTSGNLDRYLENLEEREVIKKINNREELTAEEKAKIPAFIKREEEKLQPILKRNSLRELVAKIIPLSLFSTTLSLGLYCMYRPLDSQNALISGTVLVLSGATLASSLVCHKCVSKKDVEDKQDEAEITNNIDTLSREK